MKIGIERNGHWFSLNLPCTEDDMETALQNTGITDPFDTTVKITGVEKGCEFLQPLVGSEQNLDHMNLLARMLDGLDHTELMQYKAAVQATGVTTLKDLVNLTQNLSNYSVVFSTDTVAQAGRRHYLDIHGYISLDEERSLDFMAVAQELMANNRGIRTDYGLVFENGLDYNMVFNGTNIPLYVDQSFVFACCMQYGGKREYVLLPCEDRLIDKALHRLGAEMSDCTVGIAEFKATFPDTLTSLIGSAKESDVYALNRLANEMLEFDEDDAEKICVLWDFVQEHHSSDITGTLTALAHHRNSFEYAPFVENASQLGVYLIKESYAYQYDPALEGYYDYEQFGKDTVLKQGGLFLDAGYVGIRDALTLAEILDMSENMRMGGIT